MAVAEMKLSVADKRIPKCNLGTRAKPASLKRGYNALHSTGVIRAKTKEMAAEAAISL